MMKLRFEQFISMFGERQACDSKEQISAYLISGTNNRINIMREELIDIMKMIGRERHVTLRQDDECVVLFGRNPVSLERFTFESAKVVSERFDPTIWTFLHPKFGASEEKTVKPLNFSQSTMDFDIHSVEFYQYFKERMDNAENREVYRDAMFYSSLHERDFKTATRRIDARRTRLGVVTDALQTTLSDSIERKAYVEASTTSHRPEERAKVVAQRWVERPVTMNYTPQRSFVGTAKDSFATIQAASSMQPLMMGMERQMPAAKRDIFPIAQHYGEKSALKAILETSSQGSKLFSRAQIETKGPHATAAQMYGMTMLKNPISRPSSAGIFAQCPPAAMSSSSNTPAQQLFSRCQSGKG